MTTTAYERIVGELERHGKQVKHKGQTVKAQCPAHEDHDPSLLVSWIEGSVLICCHAGCETDQVLDRLGLTMRDLYDDQRGQTYLYDDGRKVRRTYDKRFSQSGNKATNTLFRLEKVLAAVAAGEIVYLVEGEKDVLTLESIGVTATTAPMGASNVNKCDFTPLKNASVVAVVDKDEAGKGWAAKVKNLVRDVAFMEAREGKDAADHVAAGGGIDSFIPIDLEVVEDKEVPERRTRITWASEIKPKPVVWAWKEGDAGRIPAGSLSIAAGREGTGKSSWGIWMAAQITRGLLPGSFYGKPKRVFYVSVEDSWSYTLVPRLIAAGANLDMVGRLDVVTDEDEEVALSLPHDNYMLEKEIADNDVALVVIDPLMSVIGERIDTHREREVRSALDPLTRIADRTGALLLGIAHFNKGSSTDAASLITGSGAFKNVPRSVFGFATDTSDEAGGRVMTQVKNSLGRNDLPSLVYTIESAQIDTDEGITETGKFIFLGQTDRSVEDVLRDSRRDPEDVAESRDAASFILDYLEKSGGLADAGDVLAAGKAAGYAEKTLKNARSKVADTQSTGNNRTEKVHTWTWSLRKGPVEPSPVTSIARCVVCRKRLRDLESTQRGDCGSPTCQRDRHLYEGDPA